MKKLKKSIFIISILFFLLIVLANQRVLAISNGNFLHKVEYSEEFKKWLELSEEERKNVIQPRAYNIPATAISSKNPFLRVKMLRTTMSPRYSLKDVISANLIIRDQMQTNTCWAFAAISSLETNLALANIRNGINTKKVYDFSERHMEYANSKNFKDGEENKLGYNKNVDDGGSVAMAESYLTSGKGAINETEMPFENDTNLIDISEIQNKTVTTTVYDTIMFDDYQNKTDEERTNIMNQIKQHIQEYGSVFASMHGATASSAEFTCYNEETAAKYCSNPMLHKPDHAVSIIGWDDNFSIDKFAEGNKPSKNGAWIIRNSWGEKIEYNLSELKEMLFQANEEFCKSQGWNEPSQIPNQKIQEIGYTIEDDIAYIKIGDNGLMYVSYEDCNISSGAWGIIKANDTKDYDNIYQYDEFYPMYVITSDTPNIMVASAFDKKTTGKEYLTQVAFYTPEPSTCEVYVNPNGESKNEADLQPVNLKAGKTESVNAGYHTLEFAEPIEIKANKFVVVIKVQGQRRDGIYISVESKIDELPMFDFVTTQKQKCFIAQGNDLSNCIWLDLGTLSSEELVDADGTIKAFTVSEVYDESIQSIEIQTPPSKTKYYEGENFNKAGMVVKVNYNSKNKPYAILDDASYNIENGTDLKLGQTSVTITYKDKSAEQLITVEKNSVTKLEITNPPTKVEYKEGQHFDKTGMVVEATYKDGTKKEITNYTIKNGYNVKNGQTEVIICYEEQTVNQTITVTPNPLEQMAITKAPNKTNYVVGQNFNTDGMVITGTFADGDTEEILDYTVENGTNLTIEQTEVRITYGEKTVTQKITVEEKAVVEIKVETMPTKIKYIQNKEDLNIEGGSIKVIYNDETTEVIPMSSEGVTVKGFDNANLGNRMVTVTYENKTTQFEVEIIEEEKAVNSNLENVKSNVNKIKAYYYTDDSKKDYILIDVEITNIIRNMTNDKVEYYYYLSSNANEENITEWNKVTNTQNDNNKIQVTIDSRNIPNYNKIASEDVVYLYIKEVAVKGGNQSIAISKAMKLESDNDNIETYMNDTKKDNTTASGILPQAGTAPIVLIGITLIFVVTVICYIKYYKVKDIK